MSQTFISFIRRAFPLALVVAIVAGVLTATLVHRSSVYRATVTLQLTTDPSASELSGSTSSGQPSANFEALNAQSAPLRNEVAKALRARGLEPTPNVQVTPGTDTTAPTLTIAARSESREQATATAEQTAQTYLDRGLRARRTQLRSLAGSLDTRSRSLRRQINSTKDDAARAAIGQQYALLLAQESRLRASAQAAKPAGRVLNGTQVVLTVLRSPARLAAGAALFGFAAAVALLLLVEMLRQRVRVASDLETEQEPLLVAEGGRKNLKRLAGAVAQRMWSAGVDSNSDVVVLSTKRKSTAEAIAKELAALRGGNLVVASELPAPGSPASDGSTVAHGTLADADAIYGQQGDPAIVIVIEAGSISKPELASALRPFKERSNVGLVLVTRR